MPAGPAPGRTVEQASEEEVAARARVAAARWDPWRELLAPIVIVLAAVFGLAAAVGLLAVMS